MEEYGNPHKSRVILYAAFAILGLAICFTFVISVIALGIGGKAYALADDNGNSNNNIPSPVVTSLSSTPPSGYYALGSTVVSGWKTNYAPLTFARSDHQAVTLADGIYVMGGTGSNGEGATPTTNVVEMYTPSTDTWTTKAPLQQSRYRFAASVIANKIYVTGGRIQDDLTALSSLEVYDPTTNTWTYKSPLPFGISDHTSFAINGILYVVGGYDGDYSNILNTTFAYDPSKDSWMQVGSINVARGDLVGVAYNGKGYLTGGWGYPDYSLVTVLEEFDPNSNTWIIKEGTTPDRGGDRGYEVLNGRFIVVGGEGEENSNSKPLQAVELYDIKTGLWTPGSPIPYPILRTGCSVWDTTSTTTTTTTTLYCFGGQECPGGFNTACLLDGPAVDVVTVAAYAEHTVYSYAPLS